MKAAGFSIVELLIATAITMSVVAAALTLSVPARRALEAQPEAADVTQRLRAAVDALRADLLMAGAGVSITPEARGPLLNYFAPILPYRDGVVRADPDAGIYYRRDALTLVYVPQTTAQAAVRSAAGSAAAMTVELRPSCGSAHDAVCGFREGMHTLMIDASGSWDPAVLQAVNGTAVDVRLPRGVTVAVNEGGAAVAEAVTRTYWLKTDARAGATQLMLYDGLSTDTPLVDNVVLFQTTYFADPDPPRLLNGVDLTAPMGPWTTYGPKPPPAGVQQASGAWPPGENCTFTLVDGVPQPRLAVLGPSATLVELTPGMLTDGPWCPEPSSSRKYDADLLRIRRVRLRMRVQASSPAARGSSAVFFNPGRTRVADRLVPDREVQFDVVPRNMAAGR